MSLNKVSSLFAFKCCSKLVTNVYSFQITFSEKLRSQFFQQLSSLLAISDIIQTSSTFLGDYARYYKCRSLHYILQFGYFFKTSILLIIGATAWYIVLHLSIPTQKTAILATTVFIPIVLIIIFWGYENRKPHTS